MLLTRRAFLKSAALMGAAEAVPLAGQFWRTNALGRSGSFELEEMTIGQMQSGLRAGRFSSRQLVSLYLERIEAVDRRGPAVNAVIELNPEAREIARALDEERRAKGARGPLHGIPILLKDNIDTHDRMSTTAGSLALAGSIAPRDAFLVGQLRAAGAIILGKTNLSEWANFRSNHSTSGWSGRGGQTRNPYVLDRNPCGSSSGSGVAVSANFCAAAIGTETDGSIVCPSSVNGIVGIKPTRGLVSRSGIIPIAHSQDTAGPMARGMADAAVLLSAMTAFDPRDPAAGERPEHLPADYTRFLDRDGLRGARVGLPRKLFGDNPHVTKLMEAAIEELKRLGAELVDPADIPANGKLGDPELEVLLYEFKADLNGYLESLGQAAPVHSLKEIIAFNEAHREKEMPYFGQDIMIQAEAKGPLTEQKYLEARERCRRLARTEGIDAVMGRHRLDALIAPTEGPACPIDWANGDHFTGGSSTPAAVAGCPSVTVPMGFVFGLPVGLSFFGRAFSEPTLIRLAYGFEQATRHRRPPAFLPTLPARE